MRPKEIKEALKSSIATNRVPFIWGAPGVGKSDVVAQVAKELNRPLIDIRLNLYDPVDLRGFPYRDPESNSMKMSSPSELPTDPQSNAIVFLDEMNTAAPATQNAALQLVLNRRIGEYVLPPNVRIIAAGNRESDRTYVSRMSSALASRFVHLDFDVNLDDFSNWALDNDVSPELLQFLRFRTNLLHNFNPNERTFPCPRTWMFIDGYIKQRPNPSIEFEMYKGTVGEGAAAEFLGFLKVYRNLPDPDAVLLNPTGATIPTDPATLYALCGALASRASDQNFGRFIEFADRTPAEFQVMMVRDAIKRAPKCTSTKSFQTWAIKNADVLVG